MNSCIKKHPFTLVEILTVIVIAVIIFSIGIPAFSTMIQGNSMTIALRQFSTKIQAARAYAVTNRCRVALLLPMGNMSKDAAKYVSYRVCKVTDSNGFEEWIEDEPWCQLPNGIVFNTVTNPNSVGNGTNTIDDTSSTSCNALIFKKDGTLALSGSGNPVIKLDHGRFVTGSAPTPAGGTSFTITVNQYSGKAKIEPIE